MTLTRGQFVVVWISAAAIVAASAISVTPLVPTRDIESPRRVDEPSIAYDRVIMIALEARLASIQEFVDDPEVVRLVRKFDDFGDDLGDLERVIEADRRWQEGDDALFMRLADNELSTRLRRFLVEHEGFREIFVTDREGRIIGLSGRTSDFYQADEGWWRRAYAEGRGYPHFGAVEFDESAGSVGFPLYAVVKDGAFGEVSGVVKAIYDLDAIKEEL